ncbi:MAG: peptidoglycan-binding protein [Nitrospira defluvii]|nr:peptidoglycan-binding protein [Nitrospira defluvii]
MNQAPQSVMQRALQTTVIVCAAVLVFAKWMHPSGDQYGGEVPEVHDAERNERSTPRSFVLPATPGISFEQERQVAEKDNQDQIATCVGRLKDLGYDVGDGRPMLNVQLVEGVYHFQAEHHLPVTGRLDPATMRAMQCS